MPAKKTATTKKTKATKKDAAKIPALANKKEIITQYQIHGKDTGSARVQVAILTNQINSLSAHLNDHPKDKHSRRGLLGMVGQRRKQLQYLRINDPKSYRQVIGDLGLRK